MPGRGIDTRSELTVFLITVGEPSFPAARQALEEQDCLFHLDVVWNVAPMSAAFQEMLNRCTTKYYIQVDADMVLKPHAIRTMYEGIKQTEGTRTAMVCWPLFDAHLERTLLGVKAYRHDVFRRYPYTDTQSCEMDQIGRLRADGWEYAVHWGDWSSHYGHLERDDLRVLGLHGTAYPPRLAFERYRDLMQKARFVGGSDWVFPWVQRFLERIAPEVDVETDSDLWAFLGAVSGLMSHKASSRGEKDYREYAQMADFGEVAAHLVKAPQRIDVYTTSRCNFACTFCARQRSHAPVAPDFTPALATRVLQIFPSVNSACIAGFGEPLLNPHLPGIVDVFAAKGYTSLITNGFHVQDRINEIDWSKLGYVNVSLNAITPEEHAKRCGVDGAYSRAMHAVQLLRDRGVKVVISFVVDAASYPRIPDYISFAKRHEVAVSVVNTLPHHAEGNAEGMQGFRHAVITENTPGFASSMLEYKRHAQMIGADVWAWPVAINPGNCPRTCRSPFIALGVDGSGNISGCCRVQGPSATYGNIGRGALLWGELPYLRELRRELSGASPLRFPCTLCFGNWGGGT